MAIKPSFFLFIFCSFVFSLLLRLSQASNILAPALYVFGDSTVDVGNNNPFNSFAKSNYPPYGVDFPTGPTGRPTNGYNIADFFAQWLGLNLPPAFRLVKKTTPNIYHGLNYASSSAGILPETAAKMFKCVMSLGEQVDLFQKTIEKYLPSHYHTKASLEEHISKSIYLVVVGVNDIGLTFISKENSTNPLDYVNDVDLLIQKLGNRLKDLYKLGARKFVVFEVEALGCLPFYVAKFKPANSKCVEYMNSIVKMFNARLSVKLQELQYKFPGSIFVLGKYYDFSYNLVANPSIAGLKDATKPCCIVLPFGVCDPMKAPCHDRNSYAFFDGFHPTEATYKVFAEKCFNGSGSCVPLNVKQLAAL